MLADPAAVAGLDGHRDVDTAVPTPDHFLPLLHRREITVRMVEPSDDDGVLLGVDAPVEALSAVHQLLAHHCRFPVTCYART